MPAGVRNCAVRGAGLQHRDHRHAGPQLVRHLLDRPHDLRRERRGRGERSAHLGDRDRYLRVVDELDQRRLHLLARDAREDAAVDVGARPLRQGVGGVAGAPAWWRRRWCAASRCSSGPRPAPRRLGVVRIGHQRAPSPRRSRRATIFAMRPEEGAVGVVELHREVVGADPVERAGQLVDGVVRHRPGASGRRGW